VEAAAEDHCQSNGRPEITDRRWRPDTMDWRWRLEMTESPSTGSGGSLPSFVLTALLYIQRSCARIMMKKYNLHCYRSIYSNNHVAEVRKETGRCKDRWKIRDVQADERCSPAMLGILTSADVRRRVTAEVEVAVSEVSEPELREWMEGTVAGELGGGGKSPLFLPTPAFMASSGEGYAFSRVSFRPGCWNIGIDRNEDGELID